MDVGNQLKAIRIMKGVSQRELAKQSGVTNSMISQIEKNQVNPSVGSLKKILDAMSVSMGQFFTLDIDSKEQIVFGADELVDLGDGAIRMLLIAGQRANRKLTILREIYPPGADTGADFMKHEGEEGGVVLRGEIELIIGSHARLLKAGDSYYFDTRTPHRFRNKSKTECELISAATPATF